MARQGIQQGKYPFPSIPILQDKTYTDSVHPVVIVQKALAKSVVVLNVAADPFEEWKTPFHLQDTAIVMKVTL